MNEKIFELVAYLRKITGFKSLSILPFLFKGQIGIRRFSTNENFTLSEFCETYKIEVEQKELSLDGFAATDTYNSLQINAFKKSILTQTDGLHKHQTGWKLTRYQECILKFAAQCAVSPEYAEKKITPLLSYQYQDKKTVLFTPSYQLGCRHYILNSDGSTDKRWFYTVQNYLYSGYYLQPEKELEALQKAKYVVLCEGEKDVLSANYHLGNDNIFAVTCGGVANWCTASVQLNFLRNAAPNALMVSLFDHDEAGFSTAQKLEDQKIPKIVWSNLFQGELKKGFDVCDAFQTFPNAKELILKELETVRTLKELEKIRIQVEKEKAFLEYCKFESPDIVKQTERFPIRTNTYQELVRYQPIVVNKYLDESRNQLIHNLLDAKKLLIHGHTELGKTTLFKNLSEDQRLMSKLGIQHIIIVTPRVMLANEIYKNCDSMHTVLARGAHFSVTEITPATRLIITNIDNVSKLTTLFPKSLIICDEIHKVTSDTTFRSQQNVLFDLLALAPYVIMMTATPDMNLCNYMGFSYLHCSSAYRTEHKKFKYTYVPIKKTLCYLSSYLSVIAQRKDQRHLVFHNSKDKLEIAAQKCAEMGLKAIVITKDTCQALVQEGLSTLEKYDVLLCTSIADAGIDFKFRIHCVHHHFKMNTRDAVQGNGRGRGDINHITDVFCYHNEEPQTTDATENERFVPILGENQELLEFAKKGFWELIAKGEKVCSSLNSMFDVYQNRVDFFPTFKATLEKLTYFSNFDGMYKVNFAFCSQLTTKIPLSLDAHFKELQSLDNCVILNELDETEPVPETDGTIGASVKNAVDEKKQSNKALRNAAKEYIKNDLYNACLYYCNFVKNEKQRNAILDWLRTKEVDIAAGAIPPPRLTDDLDKINEIFTSLMERFFTIRKIVIDYESTHFVNLSDKEYRFELKKMITQARFKQRDHKLSPNELNAKKLSQDLRHELHKVEQNDKLLTPKELKEIVYKVYHFNHVHHSEWLMYAMCVTDLVKIKDKYKIGLQWTLEDAINVLTGATQETKTTTKKEKKAEKELEKELEKERKKREKERKKREKKEQKAAEKMENKRKKKRLKTLKI